MSKRIAVLVRQFPKLSETFIFGEISNILDAGLDIQIISLKRPAAGPQHADADKFADRTTYLDTEQAVRGSWQCIKCLGRSLFQLPAIWRQMRGLDVTLSQLCALIRVCERMEIAHLHAHFISEPALLADLASQIRGLTFSVSAHAKDIYLTDAAALRERLNNAAFVTTCTAHNHEFLVKNATDAAARIHLLYHGIDSKRFCPATRSSRGASPLIIAVGRFKRKKGFDLLIAACAALRSEGLSFRCEIIGYGSERERLQDLISYCDLDDHVMIREPVPHQELVGILQGADVCVLPCRQTEDGDRDGIPNAMLEAMSCEIPVVSTSVSGIPEVIQSGKNGVLVEPDDEIALANAIRRVLDDVLFRQKIAAAGRETVTEMFSWTTNISDLSEMLCGAVSDGSLGETA